MADPLREKFAALVEEWRKWCGSFTPQQGSYDQGMVRGYTLAADQISALLAESEPEPLVATVDRLQGILNRVQQALAKYAGDDAYRVPQESLPLLIVSLLSSKAALLPSAAIAVGSTVVPGGSTTGHRLLNRRPGPATDGDVLARKILDQIAALLAESEPEPRYFKPAPKAWGLSGHIRILPPEGEAKAKLPLGHLFVPFDDEGESDGTCQSMRCGKSRSAHEPK